MVADDRMQTLDDRDTVDDHVVSDHPNPVQSEQVDRLDHAARSVEGDEQGRIVGLGARPSVVESFGAMNLHGRAGRTFDIDEQCADQDPVGHEVTGCDFA